ncbi:MAG: pyridoxal 5'-phosphate synthase glutaminase subunit PdxT [Actinomycetota bacterium]|nr:pyridoxal 5'-phosphate synthase glutaminase subunit PdxT [Actinomycetota bacterium]
MKIGILALQGDVREHAAALRSCGATPLEVRSAAQLGDVDALVLPGGESTTIGKLLDRAGLLSLLAERVDAGMPVYGTCAGLILLARDVSGPHDAPHRVGALDVTVTRNGYGRQGESFEADLSIEGFDEPFRAVFIRAPVVERIGDGVDVLARRRDEPVLVRQGLLLASSFHPEMTDDPRVHRLFVDMVEGAR